jgi:hypothetical protein
MGKQQSLWRERDPQPPQHTPDGRGADADAETEQLAPDPPVMPNSA